MGIGVIGVKGFIQHHFRVSGQNNLGFGLIRYLGQQGIDLLLAQDFQVGVRFVDQQDTAPMGKQVGQDQKHLLHPLTGKFQIERGSGSCLPIDQPDTAARDILLRGLKLHFEQPADPLHDAVPIVRRLPIDHQA